MASAFTAFKARDWERLLGKVESLWWRVESRPAAAARLTDPNATAMVCGVTTTLTSDGHLLIPQKVRQRQKLRAGDKFEILADADEPGALKLRRVRRKPNEGLVELLRACPVKGFRIPRRSRELPPPPLEL